MYVWQICYLATLLYIDCSILGQVFSPFARDCERTCSDPYKECGQSIVDTCHCPEGTVLDEVQMKCVPISKCSKIKYLTYYLDLICLP